LFKRVLVVAVLAVIAAGAAALALRPPRGVPDNAPTEDEMADQTGSQIMQHIYNGHVPYRSGDVFLVPKPYSFILGQWDMTTLESATPNTSTTHSNPWAYLTRVPIFLYGPGYVPEGKQSYRHTDIAGLAPTWAELMRMKGFDSEGKPFGEVTRHAAKTRPKVIVTIVVDGGGWDVLQQHPGAWPNLHRLMAHGTTLMNNTIGSAPSITGALHPTFGTGDYPRKTGIPGNQLRIHGKAEPVDAWNDDDDPRFLRVETLSDEWDQKTHNRSINAAVTFEGWHLGMLGHGACLRGGDKDIAVTWDEAGNVWTTNEKCYRLPGYLAHEPLSRLKRYESGLDGRDGVRDGAWFGHTLEQIRSKSPTGEYTVRPSTSAFARWMGDASIAVLDHEPWGKDAVTDLLWVELKPTDVAGHAYNMLRPEVADVLRETDAQIGRIRRWLDGHIGRGNYVLAVSADHGQQPLPDLFGGWRINNVELARDIRSRFGDVVQKVTTVDIYLKLDRMKQLGVAADDIARFIGTYTMRDNIPEGYPGGENAPEDRLDEKLFAGAFSGRYIDSLTPRKISSFGASDYPQGDFYVRRGGAPNP
jgi:predicted AlkP superfamily pyrophosphatase or phosphodiesterase